MDPDPNPNKELGVWIRSGSIWTFLGSWIRIQIRRKTYADAKQSRKDYKPGG